MRSSQRTWREVAGLSASIMAGLLLATASYSHAQAMPPATPAAISVFWEHGQYVFRTYAGMDIYHRSAANAEAFACDQACRQSWQPLLKEAGSGEVGDWRACRKANDPAQWCYKQQPLYTYIHDKPGQALADERDGVWYRLRP